MLLRVIEGKLEHFSMVVFQFVFAVFRGEESLLSPLHKLEYRSRFAAIFPSSPCVLKLFRLPSGALGFESSNRDTIGVQ